MIRKSSLIMAVALFVAAGCGGSISIGGKGSELPKGQDSGKKDKAD